MQTTQQKDDELRIQGDEYQSQLFKKDQELRAAYDKFKLDMAKE